MITFAAVALSFVPARRATLIDPERFLVLIEKDVVAFNELLNQQCSKRHR